jgi:polyphenol oxidase
MALIHTPAIFRQFPNLRAGLTLRGRTEEPFANNLSLAVGDDPERVMANRKRLAATLGFAPERIAVQKQVHGCAVVDVAEGYEPGESDALITSRKGWLLAASVADCVPILIYDAVREVVAAVHSGWRGTRARILPATLERLQSEYGSGLQDIYLYIGASAGQCCYEVGEDVAGAFDPKHSRPLGEGKYLFDNRGVVLEQALSAGVPPGHIEVDPRCSICGDAFHSYRRDGARSGRMFSVIGMLDEAK